MSELLAATNLGVIRIDGGSARREEGPDATHFLARGADGVYACTDAGAIWRRGNEGWRLITQRAVPDDVWSFAADPRLPGRLYLGVSPAMFYRSSDGGASWTACESLKRLPGYETWTFPPPPHIAHVRSIALDPAVEGGVYIGVEEGGVYRSRDGGDTWDSLNEGLYWDVHTVVPAAAGSDVYATTGAGFHYSDDGGARWTHVPLAHRYTVPLLAPKSGGGALVTVAAEGPPPTWARGVNGAVYKSDDAGRSWRHIERGLPEALDRMPSSLIEDTDGRLHASIGKMVLTSDDAGESWRTLSDDLPEVRSLVAA
ncbi:MAG TPA: sialidase family protein [Dehalococcoidia bacterium]|nr:sialidase family protein [Dehalococcoidia bacterium]